MSGIGGPWSLLIPVKRLDIAKSRLALPPKARATLALAMAADTVRAALTVEAVGEVIVITSDSNAAETLAGVGARVVADEPDVGLNPALDHGAGVARFPLIAALASDLPALQSDDLGPVLAATESLPSAVVADGAGTGTTMLAATARRAFHPRFGPGSFAAHLAGGSVDLTTSAGRSLRWDVDTIDALRTAVSYGVGPDTARVLELLRLDLATERPGS